MIIQATTLPPAIQSDFTIFCYGSFYQSERASTRVGYRWKITDAGTWQTYWYPWGTKAAGTLYLGYGLYNLAPTVPVSYQALMEGPDQHVEGGILRCKCTVPIVQTTYSELQDSRRYYLHGAITTDDRGVFGYGSQWQCIDEGSPLEYYYFPVGTHGEGTLSFGTPTSPLQQGKVYQFRSVMNCGYGVVLYGDWKYLYVGTKKWWVRAFAMDEQGNIKYGEKLEFDQPI